MKQFFCSLLLCIAATLFLNAQSTQHGKAAKTVVKENKPLDAKTKAILQEIEERMVLIEGGTFTMGCVNPQDTDCYYWEKPRHTVMVDTFYMGKYPVTQKQWKTIMGSDPSKKECQDCPVIYVSWHDAQMFISKLNQLSHQNYRLPTEAEWEYAAKGGNKSHGYKYAGSNVAMEVAWFDTLIAHHTHPVGTKKPNELGLYDMSGNVWQWCSDWFDEKYYSKSPSSNPKGPETGNGNRVLRGGSWWGPMKDCRVANRDMYPPDAKDDDVGFRLAKD
ncbi:MAG: formylglycine-generating enzyme family protein [Chitinophagales bacterium]|nr:formylglycine-generating enzyme family protein [Chitinophagales bacterium]